MQAELFNEQREEYVLFHANQRRVLLRQSMNEFDAEMSNEYYRVSFCGHLSWMKASELKIKIYKVEI